MISADNLLNVTGPWFDMYLRERRPLVLNHNPFVMMRDDPRPEYNDQACAATVPSLSVHFIQA